jgi:hypothetical protein
MTSLAMGIWEDLREKRLWPVAALLVLSLIAVPLFLRKPAEDLPAPVAGVTAASTTADGLPSPEAMLEGGGKPLVTLAVLRAPSDLERFDVKNPFKPLHELAREPGDGSTGGGGPSVDDGGTADLSGGGAGGGGGGGETTDGGGAPAPGGDTPSQPAPAPGDPEESEQRLAYAVDLTFDGPSSPERRYRNLPRLSMLPNTNNPLLVYLGVSASGNGAVFLVDATLTAAEGEGVCTPSSDDCATISLEPGEEQYFVDDRGRRYYMRIDQIRERPVADSSDTSAQAGTSRSGGRAIRRFLPPLITDVLVRGGQR